MIFSKLRMRKQKEQEILNIFIDFATGKISTEKFWDMYKKDTTLRDALINDKKRQYGVFKFNIQTGRFTRLNIPTDSQYEFNPDNILQKVDINNLNHRYELFTIVNRFLVERGINIENRTLNPDIRTYLFFYKMLPSWVDVVDVNFLKKIYDEAPANLSKHDKLIWCKKKVKELFKYETKKPRWIQQPEWPIIDNRPFIFRYQKTSPEGFEQYFFYDPYTGKTRIIEQVE